MQEASGQNIFPEEIEDALNSLPMVVESIVVQRGDKLVGLVHPDMEVANTQNMNMEQIKTLMEQNRQTLNATQPPYCKLSAIEIYEEESVCHYTVDDAIDQFGDTFLCIVLQRA